MKLSRTRMAERRRETLQAIRIRCRELESLVGEMDEEKQRLESYCLHLQNKGLAFHAALVSLPGGLELAEPILLGSHSTKIRDGENK